MFLGFGFCSLSQGSCCEFFGEVGPAGDEGYDYDYGYDVEEWADGYACWPCECDECWVGCPEAYGVEDYEVFDEDG